MGQYSELCARARRVLMFRPGEKFFERRSKRRDSLRFF